MGVDFFPCDYCGESICDCGSYERCECGRRWCDSACAAKDGFRPAGNSEDDWDGSSERPDWEEWPDSCRYCRYEDFEDSALLNYLLKRYNLTRDQVVQEYRDVILGDDPPDAD